MARPAQIDKPSAIATAKEIFWKQGYHATSMQQLLDAMQIGSGSFYAAFGGKEALFVTILKEYSEMSSRLLEKLANEHSGIGIVKAFLEKTLVNLSSKDRKKGCLLVNSLLELAQTEHDLYQKIQAQQANFKIEVKRCVSESAQAGELRHGLTDDAASQLLLNHIWGLRVESRLGLTRSQAKARVDSFFELISNR